MSCPLVSSWFRECATFSRHAEDEDRHAQRQPSRLRTPALTMADLTAVRIDELGQVIPVRSSGKRRWHRDTSVARRHAISGQSPSTPGRAEGRVVHVAARTSFRPPVYDWKNPQRISDPAPWSRSRWHDAVRCHRMCPWDKPLDARGVIELAGFREPDRSCDPEG